MNVSRDMHEQHEHGTWQGHAVLATHHVHEQTILPTQERMADKASSGLPWLDGLLYRERSRPCCHRTRCALILPASLCCDASDAVVCPCHPAMCTTPVRESASW